MDGRAEDVPGAEDAPLRIPRVLERNCRLARDTTAWLEALPATVHALARRWSLDVAPPFELGAAGLEGSCAWVAPVATAEGTPAVLKVGMPHSEGRDEAAGLRFWEGAGMVRLLRADEELGAMLLERCVPGTPLRARPPDEQDRVIAELLPRLWRVPPEGAFRPLSDMIDAWVDGARERAGAAGSPDAGLLAEGIAALVSASRTPAGNVLLTTDLHAGNVLASKREPWLAIDPKPFVGDPCYDAKQHLLNGLPRLRADPRGTVERFSDMLGVDAARVGRWAFGRLALGGIAPGQTEAAAAIARRLAP